MIAIRGIEKRFEDHAVLRGVTIDIPEGKTVALVGESGCGKTVLLRLILGLIRPDAGSIRVDGEEVVGAPREVLFRIRRKFGMLFQGAALFDSMTVAENVALPLREHTDLSDQAIRERVAEKLALVGLFGVEHKKPAELSGGMKKRVGLARALIMDPGYVLFDEPTTGLDPIMSTTIDRLIRETQAKLGITAVVVTHDMQSAFRIADLIALIAEGRIVFEGTPDAFRNSSDPLVRRFLSGGEENREGGTGSMSHSDFFARDFQTAASPFTDGKSLFQRITEARQVLGISEEATLREIKDRYRALARRWHPDVCAEGPDEGRRRMQEINVAYHTLLDYCERYRFSFTQSDVGRHRSAEEEWLDRFGCDPLWGPG